jgi:hypothetical protein
VLLVFEIVALIRGLTEEEGMAEEEVEEAGGLHDKDVGRMGLEARGGCFVFGVRC